MVGEPFDIGHMDFSPDAPGHKVFKLATLGKNGFEPTALRHKDFSLVALGHKDFGPASLEQKDSEHVSLGHKDFGLVVAGLDRDLALANVDPIDMSIRVAIT